MADLSDVENAIVNEVVGALYPNGTSQTSAVGVTCRVYRGWPIPTALNSDLAAGIINLTIFPTNKPDEVPDAYFDTPYGSLPQINLMALTSGRTITFSGTAAPNQIVGLLIDGAAYVYRIVDGDTPESIAANIAAVIAVNRTIVLSGRALAVPDAVSIVSRVVLDVPVSRPLRRQRREIQIACWCPSPALRDSTGALIDLVLTTSSFIGLGDGTKAHVKYVSTQVYDQAQNALLYRRDLCYRFEYTLVGTSNLPVMLFGDLIKNGASSVV